jgi:hypothetical protein
VAMTPSSNVFHFVVADLGSRGIAQVACMDERKMSDVQKILDHTRAPQPPSGTNDRPIRRTSERVRRIAETNPDPVVLFFYRIDCGSGSRGGRLIRMSGNANALSRAAVFPSVIGTREAIAGDPSGRRPRSTMDV